MHSTLSDRSLSIIDKQILVLRIIHASLVMGVLAFAVFAVVAPGANVDPPLPGMDWMMGGVGVAAGIGGWILLRLLSPPATPTAKASPQGDQAEVHDVIAFMGRMQSARIVAGAMFEGGAIANVYWYYARHNLLHLVIAGVLLLFLLMLFPRRGAILDKLEPYVRRLREEREMAVARR